MHIIGFDIGGTKCAVLLCRLEGEHVIWYDRMETQTTPDWKAVLDALCSHAD